MDFAPLDARPVIVAIAGPNGAGKTTFYHAHVRRAGLPFINADVLARELDLEPYAAARMADALRREFVARGSSFVFETVFSDPLGDKRAFLQEAAALGYTVVLCYVGLSGPDVCEARVAMRVSQGGHDVPTEKLRTRYPRTIAPACTVRSSTPAPRRVWRRSHAAASAAGGEHRCRPHARGVFSGPGPHGAA
jgi:predicted ABC-type ATPase